MEDELYSTQSKASRLEMKVKTSSFWSWRFLNPWSEAP